MTFEKAKEWITDKDHWLFFDLTITEIFVKLNILNTAEWYDDNDHSPHNELKLRNKIDRHSYDTLQKILNE